MPAGKVRDPLGAAQAWERNIDDCKIVATIGVRAGDVAVNHLKALGAEPLIEQFDQRPISIEDENFRLLIHRVPLSPER